MKGALVLRIHDQASPARACQVVADFGRQGRLGFDIAQVAAVAEHVLHPESELEVAKHPERGLEMEIRRQPALALGNPTAMEQALLSLVAQAGGTLEKSDWQD